MTMNKLISQQTIGALFCATAIVTLPACAKKNDPVTAEYGIF
jgi:hypothetical protein